MRKQRNGLYEMWLEILVWVSCYANEQIEYTTIDLEKMVFAEH